VQQHAGQVVAAGTQAKELAVQQDREPGQRMPETSIQIGKGPANTLRVNTALHMRVPVNIDSIIEVHEVVAQAGQKDPNRQRKEQEAKDGCAATQWGKAGLSHGAAFHRRNCPCRPCPLPIALRHVQGRGGRGYLQLPADPCTEDSLWTRAKRKQRAVEPPFGPTGFSLCVAGWPWFWRPAGLGHTGVACSVRLAAVAEWGARPVEFDLGLEGLHLCLVGLGGG